MKSAGQTMVQGFALATFVLVGVASFLPDARLWGINHLAYFPVPLRLLLLGMVAVCFVPPFARLLLDGFLSLSTWLTSSGRNRTWVLVALCLSTVGVFWFLRMGTPLLGDGHLIAKSFTAAQDGNDQLIPSNMANILKAERIAIGTMILNHWAGRLLHQFTGLSWVDGWLVLNCFLGGAFVFLMFWAARSDGWTATTRLWLLTLALFSPVMELFFGYVENYTPLTLALMLYVASAVRVLHARGSLLWSVLALMLCIFLHVQALVFLPSLVFLVIWRLSRQTGRPVQRLPWFLAGIMALAVAGAWATPLRKFLLAWVSDAGSQAVLTGGHLLDMINEILLVLPTTLLFLGLYWFSARHAPWKADSTSVARGADRPTQRSVSKGSKRRPRPQAQTRDTGPAPWLHTRAEWQFFAIAAWGCLLYLTFFEAAIGVARDWDLFSMILFALLPLALITWNRHMQATGGFQLHSQAVVVMPMLALTLVLGMSWVVLNHSVALSARRFEAILGWENARVAYGLEALASTYHSEGYPAEAVRVMERAIVESPNKRLRGLLGTYCYDAGNYQRARELLTVEVERTPEDLNLRSWLLRTLNKLEDTEEQERVLREGVRLHPDDNRLHLLLGQLLLADGNVEEGVHHLRLGRQADMPAAARQQIDALIDKYGGDSP